MSEQDAIASLSMDRGLSLGNSEDVDARRALHVKIKNKDDEPITVKLDTTMDIGRVDQGDPTADDNSWPVHVVDSVLPDGASTEAKQDAGIALLTTIDADTSNLDVALSTRATEATLSTVNSKLNTLGQKTMAGSVPVTIASDQTPITTASTLDFIHRADVNAQVITVSGNSGTLDAGNYGSLAMSAVISAVSGTTPTLQIDIETSIDGVNWSTRQSTRRFTATGSQNIQGNRLTSRYYRYAWIVTGTTPSFTATITSTLKSYMPLANATLFRYADVDLQTIGNFSSTFSCLGNANVTVMMVRSADGGTNANVVLQASNDSLNWADVTAAIPVNSGTTTNNTFSSIAHRFFRARVSNASNAGVRVLDMFWNSNGGS